MWWICQLTLIAILQVLGGVSLVSPASAQPVDLESPQPLEPTLRNESEICVAYNSRQVGAVITIGNVSDAPYVVVIPGRRQELLTRARQCVPDAFQTESRRGAYIRAGAFPRRRPAATLTRHLRTLGLDARVVYLP
jgi:hypothetical protein